MKHRLSLLALALAATGVLAGCSSSSEKDGVNIEQHHWYDVF